MQCDLRSLTLKQLYEYALEYKVTDTESVKRLLSYGRLRKKSNSLKGDRYERMFDLEDPNTVKLLSDKHNRKLLKFLPKSMQANREVVLTFAKDEPYTIRYAHLKFLDDKEIMMIVIKTYWGMYNAVSERLMDDEEVLKATMESELNNHMREYRHSNIEKTTYHCIRFASKRLREKYRQHCVYWCFKEKLKRLRKENKTIHLQDMVY